MPLEVIVEEQAVSSQLSALSSTSNSEITNHKSQITNPVRSRPPLPAGEGRGEGRLLSLKSINSNGGLEISGAVRVAAGPWRMEEGWWTSDPADRDYWDVELSDGALYRVYRDRASGSWFADGIYD